VVVVQHAPAVHAPKQRLRSANAKPAHGPTRQEHYFPF
jgi:hypothetical protein